MEFIRTSDSAVGAKLLEQCLTGELETGKQVLWLIPGGSNIPISVAVMRALDSELTRHLTLALTDERYGPVGHNDSNWKQLDEASFDNKLARRIEVLQPELTTMEATAQRYSDELDKALIEYDTIIGQFGMGSDGHIAGILPNTPAVEAADYAVGYHTEKFDRITMTFGAIQACSVAFLFVFGIDKLPALENLQKNLDLREQPAQILKRLSESYIYNDQIGDKE